ncbi:MAG: anthranilate phosphoribosyltransferase [Planctomycetota bacterium]
MALDGPSEFAKPTRPGELTPFLRILLAGGTLDERAARAAFEELASGESHHAEMGALLALLATRVPTVDEIVGAASVMRARVERVPCRTDPKSIVDTAGTGGAPKTFNVSTLGAIVAAAAGAKVAKHGNRSRTGRGSAEVMQRLGVDIDAPPATQARCLDEAGISFSFAIHHHPAAKHVMPVRKALGLPTIFNLLGPLTNPAGARRQVMGVYAPQFVEPIAEALVRLGAVHAFVLHSDDGLDEISIAAPTMVAEVRDGSVRRMRVDPAVLGLEREGRVELEQGSLEEAATVFVEVLEGRERGARRSMVLVNAAAAIAVGGVARSIEEGVRLAGDAIDSGRARATLDALRELSRARG